MEWADLGQPMLAFLLGLASAYIGLYWKIKKGLEAAYDKDLRSRRTRAYVALWKLLQPLAKYSPPEALTSASLEKLSADLRRWYFEVGGLFMSQGARDAYFALQDDLVASAGTPGKQFGGPGDTIAPGLRAKGSALRTATTIDIGSRRPPLIGHEPSGGGQK